jgi:Protein of unknown function (DUF3800)
MNEHVSIGDLFRVLLPRDCRDGCLAMLTAYFDDTGTHSGGRWGPSKVVAVAGIIGTEGDLRGLESEWRNHLDRPLCGRKPPLKRFHMYDCQNSLGEFIDWSRTETDYFTHQLATVIGESGVAGYGMACSRKDWEELVTGDARAILGDPEGTCVRNCFLRAAAWAQHNTFDRHMTFVFDDFDARPERQRDNKVVFDVFRRQTLPPPELVGFYYTTSHKILPLQAADLVAWEFYQHAKDALESGLLPPRRRQWQALGSKMKFHGQIARRPAIQQIVDHVRAHPRTEEIADHFRTFDPDASA